MSLWIAFISWAAFIGCFLLVVCRYTRDLRYSPKTITVAQIRKCWFEPWMLWRLSWQKVIRCFHLYSSHSYFLSFNSCTILFVQEYMLNNLCKILWALWLDVYRADSCFLSERLGDRSIGALTAVTFLTL